MAAQNWQRDPGRNSQSQGTSRKSAVGTALKYMYAPRFGRSVGEIGRTSEIFVRLIAGVFVTQDLFPRNHPALKDNALRLTLGEVVSTAFRSLQWTKDGLPQIAFFFAIIGTIIVSIIGFFLALGSILSTPAHAGLVEPPFPLQDVGNKWLEHIFNNGDFVFQNMAIGGADYGMLTGDAVQTPEILKQIAVMYANVMLILAVIILFYHLIAMTVHTAHEGTVMGRNAHQIWAPVRLVFALGLLVPVADGWSSGQWLVMQIAKWGSGMASNIWDITSKFPTPLVRVNPDLLAANTLNHLEYAGRCVVNNAYREGANGPEEINQNNVLGVQNLFRGIDGPGPGTIIRNIGTAGAPGLASGFNPAGPNFMVYAGPVGASWWTGTACGMFYTPDVRRQITGAGPASYGGRGPDAANLERISTAYIDAFNEIKNDAFMLGVDLGIVENRINGSAGLNIDYVGRMDGLQQKYLGRFIASLGAAIGPGIPGPGAFAYDPASNQLSYRTIDPYLPDQRGWMSAGMYFMELVGAQSHAQRMIGLPVVSGMPLSSDGAEHAFSDSLAHSIAERNQEFQYNAAIPNTLCGGSVANGASLDLIKKVIYCVGFIPLGLMDRNFQMTTGRQFAGTGDSVPFADMVNFGGKLVNSAGALIKLGLALNAAQAATAFFSDATKQAAITAQSQKAQQLLAAAGIATDVVKGIVELGAMLSTFVISFGVIMFFPGFILFYLLPALPFINFVLGCITWIISLLLATIAIPVIAIGHLSPNGEGLPSASTRGAYVMVLQIFLRPVMMIFGLYVTILLANTGLVFASVMFNDTTNSYMTGSDPLSQLVYFVLYAGLCYGIVNAAITSIDDFPLKAVAWINGQTVDSNHNAQTALAGALAGQTVAQQVTGGLTSLRYGGMPQGALEAKEMEVFHSKLVQRMNREHNPLKPEEASSFRMMGSVIGSKALANWDKDNTDTAAPKGAADAAQNPNGKSG